MKKRINFFKMFLFSLVACAVSCNKQTVLNPNLSSLSKWEINVSNDNGILNFETLQDYEEALNILASLEQSNKLSMFEDEFGFYSYRNAVVDNNEIKNEVLDDILATFLNPERKVVIENNLYEIDIPKNKVSVYQYENCNLKSTSNENLIGIYTCDDDVFDIINSDASFKSTSSTMTDYCVADDEYKEYMYEVTDSRNLSLAKMKLYYFKAGIYYTLNSYIDQDLTKTTITLYSSTCKYTPKDKDEEVKSGHTETANDWDRHFRPYWGFRRLTAYSFEVKFTSTYQGEATSLNKTLNLNCTY